MADISAATIASGNSDGFTPKGIVNSAFNLPSPEKYTSLDEFINEVNAPDIRAQLIKSYGDQGITGFLKLTGAVNASGTADEVTYWEEARLHEPQTVSPASVIAAAKSQTFAAADLDEAADFDSAEAAVVRVGDIVLMPAGERAYVSAVTKADGSFTVKNLLDANLTAITAGTYHLPIIGNLYAQGTDQPGNFLQSNVVKRTNDYAIIKESYKVSGSQATNVGYIDLGGGDYRWYLKSEQDTRQRFLDKREMMMLMGQKVTSTDSALSGIKGTEGYFAAIEDRGINATGDFSGTTQLDIIIKQMDKQGCPAEYAIYGNSDVTLALDDAIAGINSGGGLSASYGAFNNDRDMAVNLGFASFARGGYTFHKHNWKLLNDPTLLDGFSDSVAQGVMIPIANVTDPKTGNRAPALELNYKATNGYSRELEHWVTGGGVLGFTNNTEDLAQFNYRSEACLVTRAANQHVLLKND